MDFFLAFDYFNGRNRTAVLAIGFLALRPLRHSTRIAVLITAISVMLFPTGIYGMVYLVGANTHAPFSSHSKQFAMIYQDQSAWQTRRSSNFSSFCTRDGFIAIDRQKTKMKNMLLSVDSDAAQLMGVM